MPLDPAKLHVFPADGDYAVYDQASNAVFLVNASAVAALQDWARRPGAAIPRFMESATTVLAPRRKGPVKADQFAPTTVTLFPSDGCQLRCIYCYAAASRASHVMPLNVALSAIDFVIQNACQTSQSSVSVSFHGGGEPFFGAGGELTIAASEYAAKQAAEHHLELRLHASTNGVLNKRQLAWIRSFGMGLQLSFDGPKAIQDRNRPAIGGSSFERVSKTLEYLEAHRMKYSLRATVTQSEDLQAVVRFFSEVSTVGTLSMEPLAECGRSAASGARSPAGYAAAYSAAVEYAAGLGWNLRSSMDCSVERNAFCGATTPNFCVTPEGSVSSCFEISQRSDPKADTFMYGRFTGNAFEFDAGKMAHLRARTVERLARCRSCEAQNFCGGDCLTKTAGDIYDAGGTYRCEIIRSNFARMILAKARRLRAHALHA